MWTSTTLGSLFAKQLAAANSQITAMQAEVARLTPLESDAANSVSSANALVNSIEQYIESLKASGIYTIALSPAQGAWANRLLAAANAPVRGGGVTCAIIASIMQGPTLSGMQSAYGAMKSALTTAISPPSQDAPPVVRPEAAVVPEPQWGSEDEWDSVSVSDAAPAELSAATAQLNEARKTLAKAQTAKNTITARKTAANDALTNAKSTATALAGTGTYKVILAPMVGDWYSRLTTEPGAPSNSGTLYCAGTVTIVQAADAAQVIAAWNSLLGAIQ